MKPVQLHSWGVINSTGEQFLNPLEQEIRDCCIRGRTFLSILNKKFPYIVETTPICDSWQGQYHGQYGFFIRTRNDDVFELVGEPNNDYSRLFHLDRERFAEVVTKKLKLI
jgi:hypothetical protein